LRHRCQRRRHRRRPLHPGQCRQAPPGTSAPDPELQLGAASHWYSATRRVRPHMAYASPRAQTARCTAYALGRPSEPRVVGESLPSAASTASTCLGPPPSDATRTAGQSFGILLPTRRLSQPRAPASRGTSSHLSPPAAAHAVFDLSAVAATRARRAAAVHRVRRRTRRLQPPSRRGHSAR
jgi:hypothetical protein